MEEELEHIGVVKDDCNGFPWKRIGYVCETDLAVLPIGAKVYGPDVVEALRTQIAELKADAVSQDWKPIETAPKDCGFLGYQKITPDLWVIVPMYWSGSEYLIIQFHSDNTEHPMKPTRWKPLPAPPKGEKE